MPSKGTGKTFKMPLLASFCFPQKPLANACSYCVNACVNAMHMHSFTELSPKPIQSISCNVRVSVPSCVIVDYPPTGRVSVFVIK